jgi:hypothetical protein
MATEKEMYELIGRAVANAEFRAKLMAEPEQAAKEAGYTLTAEQLAALQSPDLQGLAQILNERTPKLFGPL